MHCAKWFEDVRLWGCLCIAVDGTLCERKRGPALSDREKRRYALEARIVTPWGWDIPVMDPCRSYGWGFLLTFKEGVMPKVWKDVCDAQLRMNPVTAALTSVS